MRIISQDGTLDVPYNDYQLFVSGAKYDAKEARKYCQSSYAPSVKLLNTQPTQKHLKLWKRLEKCMKIMCFIIAQPIQSVLKKYRVF